jgi:S-adenosylmethionine synthetase
MNKNNQAYINVFKKRMEKNIIIEDLGSLKVENLDVEIVERKGLGHPDTICDAASEAASRELCKYYLKEFGTILHHNVDKALLIAGSSKPNYGGGKLAKPIKIIVAGRAVNEAQGNLIPVSEIATKATKDILNANLHGVDIDNSFVIDTEIGGGSVDLQEVFGRAGMPNANDTSFGVGFAPLSVTEQLVLGTANLLNSKEFLQRNPFVGSDVKVMGVRKHGKIDITVAAAILDKYVESTNHYFDLKAKMSDELNKLAEPFRNSISNITFHINTADSREKKIVYITTTGLSAEMGDDGQVGRGNRVNGLITVRRPMSLEAAAGKNPVNHIGKLYNVLSNIMAEKIVRDLDDVEECYVNLLSQIGRPINEPQVANILISTKSGVISEEDRRQVSEISSQLLDDITQITNKIVSGEICVY